MKNSQSLGKVLSKEDQKQINGGYGICGGYGTGGVTSEGYAETCNGHPSGTYCLINGYGAVCTGNGGGFWFY